MAMEAEWSCPICQEAREEVAYVMPCRHQFCLGCILRWTRRKRECPLCRGPVEIVRFSVREQDCLEYVFTYREASPDASSPQGGTPGRPAGNSPQDPTASPPSSAQGALSPHEERAAEPVAVGGLLPDVWAGLFQTHQHLLDPVLLWLRQELEAIHGARWWHIRSAESSVLHALCVYGPDEEAMVRELQGYLEEYTAPLVQGVINTLVCRCSQDARRLLRSHAAGEEDESPAASSGISSSPGSSRSPSISNSSSSPSRPSRSRGDTPDSRLGSPSSPAGSDVEAQPSRSQEQPQEEPGQAVAAGPSAQARSRSPSAPGRGRDCSPGGPRHPPKRRAPSP